MTALAADRAAVRYGTTTETFPIRMQLGVAASTTLYGNGIVCRNSSGYAVAATATTGLVALGVAETQVVNSSSAGAATVDILPGVWYMKNSSAGDLITIADIGNTCYLVDDQTVAKTDGSGTRSAAGIVVSIGTSGPENAQVAVMIGPITPISYVQSSTILRARGVSLANVANLAAFTVAGVDGLTYAKGDVILLACQTTAAQNGLYLVGTVGGGTAALTRVGEFASGTAFKAGVQVNVAEGTIFGGTTWKATTASGTVGTNDPAFYPRSFSGQTALVAGTFTLAGWFMSADRTNVVLMRTTANTCTLTTGGYHVVGGITPGVYGTGAATVDATVAAGTINVADISTLNWTVLNPL